MHTSNISIDVLMDADRIPETISWNATDSTAEMDQKAKAMMLAFWDAADKSALRIDLWTKDMMIDEMADFYYQVMMTMADTFQRATNQPEIATGMKTYAKDFLNQFKAEQLKQNQ
jgi:gliding motility-associated protein GldC